MLHVLPLPTRITYVPHSSLGIFTDEIVIPIQGHTKDSSLGVGVSGELSRRDAAGKEAETAVFKIIQKSNSLPVLLNNLLLLYTCCGISLHLEKAICVGDTSYTTINASGRQMAHRGSA